ncbi:MAG: BREX-1 system adenine-specific DNA-methyltransferase PglX [Oscillospiraceae bacterium]
MNKNAIQKFAIWARNELIAQVSQRAYQYGIDESGFGDASADTLNGRLLTAEEKSQRQELIKQIKEKGYKQVMEEVAYTWFNRFIALRFMEVNNYLPSHIRVFSDASGAFKPEILNDVLHLDLPGLDSGKVAEYIESNGTEALYRYLLLTQCNALNSALPVMFERMGGYTEMLLPNNILRQDSVLGHMVSDIPEEDWQDAIQIIGWLYQYYNTELKDDTFAQLKKNVKITKERIPAATQLFTPDWIVRYMVENSLGRLWLEGHPNAELRGGWKYYLDEAEQEPEVEAQLAKLREEYKTIKPEEIKVIDPCMGSGHILVYAFDVLMQIYTSAGWDQREAAQSILKNNLFGLDIDDRAAQLAYFAVMMKARQYDRRLLTRGIQPNIYSIRESNGINRNQLQFFGWSMGDVERNKAVTQVEYLLDTFRDAKEYGSILNVDMLDWELLYRFAGTVDYSDQISLDELNLEATKDALWTLIEQGAVLAQKYDVVVTNPPYMGASGMNARLAEYVKSNYPNTKSDMSTVFMEKTVKMCKKTGYMSMINIPVWMFLSSYEKLRESLIAQDTFANMVHFGRGVFGSDFGTTAFVIAKSNIHGYKGTYCRLFEKQGAVDSVETKEKWFLEGKGRFVADQSNFSKLPGSPVAYWVSRQLLAIFRNCPSLESYAAPKQGLITGDNDRFLRYWHEVSLANTALERNSKMKWRPINKGGEFRRWYGNQDYVVNWENDGAEILNFKDSKGKLRSRPQNLAYNFRASLSWSLVTSGGFSVRFFPDYFMFNVAGISCFPSEHLNYILGLLNTKITSNITQMLNPTINMNAGDVAKIPIVINNEKEAPVDFLVKAMISLSKADWDSYENSWDFKRNPLV